MATTGVTTPQAGLTPAPATAAPANNANVTALKAQVEAALADAKAKGLDTTSLQAQYNQIIGAGPTTPTPGTTGTPAVAPGTPQIIAGKTVEGAAINVQLLNDKYTLPQPTGKLEVVSLVNPETKQSTILRFDAAGNQTRSFEIADKQFTKVTLDHRAGIASGISNLSSLIAGRQERIKNLSDALTSDANDTGSINQVDLQRLTQENQTTENITGMQKKIYDSVQNSIQQWLR
ncbi:MAG: hypothetical protein JWM98_1014 [Thermoleophilia bacterium]|nr:hypothetical protein [Thermoleophilia bacterium]